MAVVQVNAMLLFKLISVFNTCTSFSWRVEVRQGAGSKKYLLNLYHNMMKNMFYGPHLVG
jgi:hypothetical protein